ncbi:zinc ribbon domain-containing protein [Intrasporangium sp.]|uniref:zinc ribbon domain-containing protein n=1 Tax=Intrasporangium sp. TaxID=1925024 RepID=UPI002939640A|nr:C4-type zinc ribbon domain-containing protein [Intrasporangium sp.]MDV3222524.1 C4-type zinc ribbon domain-containing protein [Intrasporangium sp.]
MKADPSRQWRLLDLQAIDTRLDQIAHARANLPQTADIAAARGELAAVETELVNARTAVDDVQRELTKSEQDVQLVRDRAARDRARLDSGQGSAKDLTAIQHELVSLARRQAELEDLEIEVMERAEALAKQVADLEARRAEVAERLGGLEEEQAALLADLEAEANRVGAGRADIVAGVGEDLVGLYEKIRAQSGGLAAAELRQRRCGGCRLELNNVDLDRIKNAAQDEVVRCEECRRIMIRTGESGL